MIRGKLKENYVLRILDKPQEMAAVEALQQRIWPGNDVEIVPGHMLLATSHNGGLVIGAYQATNPNKTSPSERLLHDGDGTALPPSSSLVGFVFGFPGLYETPDGPRLKHHSHMLGVLPEARDLGLGFALKRAQWQMVRRQGIDRITWTYDPLLSRNAHLNIARLGAVCNTYLRDVYGEMRDQLNAGLPSDRFQVDWWVNTQRVSRRLSKRPRPQLDLAHFLDAGTIIINPSQLSVNGLPMPGYRSLAGDLVQLSDGEYTPLLLLEIPADFQALRKADITLAGEWRLQTRSMFEELFVSSFLISDFIHLPGSYPRSFYVLSNGESTL
jgi:predicted GNAT superfamily acetyltransferase